MSIGKAMQFKSEALSKLSARLKLATGPASRCFLVALFISGFYISYLGGPPAKTDAQNLPKPDVANHSPKPAIVLVHAVSPMDRSETIWLVNHEKNQSFFELRNHRLVKPPPSKSLWNFCSAFWALSNPLSVKEQYFYDRRNCGCW
jgi:hypothetical protein